MSKNIVIIGAGPAGMFCSLELSNAGYRPILIEKEEVVGGLAKTLEFREGKLLFRTDIGPHRFFSKNRYLYRLIEDLLKDDWLLVNRKTRQFIEGKFYDYPINFMQALRNIGLMKSLKIINDYALARFNYKILKKRVVSFEDYIVANFGRSLGNLNMLNYTEKVWGIPCREIHPDWAIQRISGLNLFSALKNAIKGGKEGPKTLVDNFYYPRLGTGMIYEKISERVRGNGTRIFTESYPTVIRHSRKRITEVEVNIKGRTRKMKPDFLVESIPMTDFVNLLSPKPPKDVLDAAKSLRWRSQVYLFITLDKDKITPDNWIYFPNKDVPFGRVAEMKNFSHEMSPKGKTSLFVEFFVFEGDNIWNLKDSDLFDLVMKHFEGLGFFRKEEVRNYYVFKKRNIYPVYDLDYQKHLDTIKRYLDGFSNLAYVGRPGRFKYNNQDHSMEMGILAAKTIIDGKKYDIDKCGSEKEYFEKGKIDVKEDSVEKKSYNWLILEDRGGSNEG